MQRRSDLIAIDVISRDAHGFEVYSALAIPAEGRPYFICSRYSLEACVAELARAYPDRFSREEFMRMIETQKYSLKKMADMYEKILLEIDTGCDPQEIKRPDDAEHESLGSDEILFEADDFKEVV